MARWRFEAIGTRWEIETAQELSDAARTAVAACIAAFDADWSRFRPDSRVSRLAASAAAVTAPPDTTAMLDLYADLSEATGGAVNPLVGESLARLGYDAALTLRPGEPAPAPERWRDVLRWDAATLAVSEPALIDVGALGKGRLVDLVLGVLAGVGGEVIVDAGGDMAVRGGPIRVGLEHPYDASRAIGVVEVSDAALCASATNRRAWGEGLHHVLDARTGLPVRKVVATWAHAPTAMLADAAATALFFDGGPAFAAARGVAWVRMTSAGAAEWSPGFPGEIFTL